MNHIFIWMLFAVILLSYVVPFVMAVFGLLRFAIFPIKFSSSDKTPLLSDLQQASLDELKTMGFNPIASYSIHEGSNQYQALMLRHNTLPAFANIYFRPSYFAGYGINFFSFTKDGKILLTVNREPTAVEFVGTQVEDAFAGNPSLHWMAHENRMKKTEIINCDDATAYSRMAQATENHFAHCVERGIYRKSRDYGFMSFPAAIKMAMKVMGVRKHLRKPYQTVLTSEKFQSAYYAEQYQALEQIKSRSIYRIDLVVILFFLSLATTSAILTWFLGWPSAIAILTVLLVHESGHAIAMRLFGYRDMNMFFVPFVGAVVTGNARMVSVWKQTIVLLAGPVPGFLVGLWICLHPHLYPAASFIHHLGLFAVGINLFNLLPLSFLDGGRILEIAFVARWPYAIFVFSLLSCVGLFGLMLWTKSYNLLVIIILITGSLKTLWQITTIRNLSKREPEVDGKLKRLFEMVRKKFGNLSFQKQYRVVKAVYDKPNVNPPKIWETIFALSLFILIWLPIGLVVLHR